MRENKWKKYKKEYGLTGNKDNFKKYYSEISDFDRRLDEIDDDIEYGLNDWGEDGDITGSKALSILKDMIEIIQNLHDRIEKLEKKKLEKSEKKRVIHPLQGGYQPINNDGIDVNNPSKGSGLILSNLTIHSCPSCGKEMKYIKSNFTLLNNVIIPDLERWQCQICKENFFDIKALEVIEKFRKES